MARELFEQEASQFELVNETNLILIPKVEHPETVSNFRPISLCNYVYKIVAKVLANRLKGVLEGCVSENQRAFVPNRMINDNSIIVHEAFHYLRNKRVGEKYELALKMDMNKAYNRLEWNFLEAVMTRMNFCRKWIRWIMNCVNSVTFKVQLSGRIIAEITPQRGLRQGDPLSPYIFIIASEALSAMIHAHEDDGSLKGIKLARGSPPLTHCMFADDTIMFLNATTTNCRLFVNFLDRYCMASCQRINFDKSYCFFQRTHHLIREQKLKSVWALLRWRTRGNT